jgi:hypothetical protein
MPKQVRQKQERIIEAVRQGLEGDAAVSAIHNSGFAMTSAGIARHLRSMGGRGHVQTLINEGKSNIEILEACFPEEDAEALREAVPHYPESTDESHTVAFTHPGAPVYETIKHTVHLPADLQEAIRLAAKAEGKSQNQLIVDLLTSALSQIPGEVSEE